MMKYLVAAFLAMFMVSANAGTQWGVVIQTPHVTLQANQYGQPYQYQPRYYPQYQPQYQPQYRPYQYQQPSYRDPYNQGRPVIYPHHHHHNHYHHHHNR